MAVRNVGKLLPKTSVLFICDMQEKFRKTIQYYPQIIQVAGRMIQAARVLNVPIIATEQYPQGLGHTVSELDLTGVPVHAKTCFSMIIPDVLKEIKDLKSVIICGIESHVCVQCTTLDLLDKGLDVHIVADACSSRSMVDRKHAFERMRQSGAFISTSESVMLQLCGDVSKAEFKPLQKLIMEPAPDSGLLTWLPEK